MPGRFGGLEQIKKLGEGVRKGRSVESIGDVGSCEGGLLWVFCCNTEDKTEEMGLVEQRREGLCVDSLPGFLAGVACGLTEGDC